jgi:hypothetical protein
MPEFDKIIFEFLEANTFFLFLVFSVLGVLAKMTRTTWDNAILRVLDQAIFMGKGADHVTKAKKNINDMNKKDSVGPMPMGSSKPSTSGLPNKGGT